MGNVCLEREVKFELGRLEDLLGLDKKLAGEELVQDWTFEKNIIFDNEKQELKNKNMVLRLRQDQEITFTLKVPFDSKDELKIKEKKEYNVKVDNFDLMQEILNYLGFKSFLIYHKFRKVYIFYNVLVCLDILPFGYFVELEGENLFEIACKLNLNWEFRSDLTYYDVYQNKLKNNAKCKMFFLDREQEDIKLLLGLK
ncbi:MAG: class IV adenylate cyclase [Desulfonauticus sp.]|nr:class IV adenylate cyclase [Desulfonauticus sp.]